MTRTITETGVDVLTQKCKSVKIYSLILLISKVSMEEAELLKVRLQAITNKRRIQEHIALKRREIDMEKLKLQHLKKRSMRDLWLMGDTSSANVQDVQKAQEVTQQTKLLQSNIHRMEREIEALEREELNICTNEGLVLKRLKSIEKSTEEIIKAANANFKSEQIHVYSKNPQMRESYTPLNLRKQPNPVSGAKTDQRKPALYAMEINVQKDLRTGESHVLSSSTVSPQELQQRGVKVYDDGRKSVYALCSDGNQPGASRVAELSTKEVEELLRQATQKKKRPQGHSEPSSPMNYSRSLVHSVTHRHHSSGCPEPCIDATWPELKRDRGVQYPGQELHESAHVFHHYGGETKFHATNNGNSHGHEMYQASPRRGCGQCYDLRDTQRGALCVDPDMNQRSPSSCIDNTKPCVLHTLPSDEPVTMIFMGYQSVDDNHQSFDGSVRAELVIIGEGEEDPGPAASSYRHSRSSPHQNHNANNSTLRRGSEGSAGDASATAS
ncbi:palmdelphin isoform X2 [Brachyhypopomus gauderio]|uniref:palmdelphin isoform X2 n=1 Tax=Brachyhypopomus gauderio TaxID=698409 RepID=UPI0040419677